MTDATKAIKWKAVYEPFGTVSSITGAAANDMRFPGQWFQLEGGLAYDWYRHYDATTGRYTQTDPLGLNQGPSAPAPSTILPSDAAPGMSLAANDNGASLSSIGTGRNGLLTGLSYLMASRQGTYGLESHTGLADRAGASDVGQRVTRNGASLYVYVKQSPLMWKDPRGLGTPTTGPAWGFMWTSNSTYRFFDGHGNADFDIDIPGTHAPMEWHPWYNGERGKWETFR